MGGLKQTPIDEAISNAEAKQEREREDKAYKKGKDRHQEDQSNPSNRGGPKGDGYGNMSPGEKEAYKKGHRGD